MQTVQHHPLLGRVCAWLGIEPGEEARVGKLTALYTLLVLGVAFVETIAFTLFVREFGSRNLPYAYIATAVLAPLAAFSCLRLGSRVSFQTLLISNVTFLIIGCTIFWMSLTSPVAHWAILLLPAWFQTQIILVNLAVWPLAGRLFDVRQSKRLFGLVGTGTWIANIVGGFIVAPLIALFGTGQMLLIAAIVTACGLWLLRTILRTEFPAERARHTTAVLRAANRNSSTSLVDPPMRRYIRLILAYVFLWWMAFFFLDNYEHNQGARNYVDHPV